MFSKSSSNPTQPQTQPQPQPSPTPATTASQPAPASQPEPARQSGPRQKGASLINADMTLEGNLSGGGEIQIDGTIKGDVRIEHVVVGDGGVVEGGIYAEAVEVRGKVSGSITAKQVRLYGACHVDGDITHEQLAMETGAFFQGRSLRLQRQATPATAKPEPIGAASLSAKTAPAGQA
ncbi:MAG TPA: polymer-forming cytoskeletal protein [Caulobacteraceae bacterium]|nr:polymer-forming cytoskeletal protein [Caulobacteraceae bacterium]